VLLDQHLAPQRSFSSDSRVRFLGSSYNRAFSIAIAA
jgi:hypothetical protein